MCRPAQMSPQLLVFPVGPSGQRAIQLPHWRIQRRAIIPPVILEPAPDDRIEHARQIFDRLIAAQMQLPAPNLRPYGLPRLVRNRRAEVDKVLAKAILRSSWPKRIAKKVELLVRVVSSSIIILAVDNLRLLRMKLQPAFLQPCGYCRSNFLGFLLCPAVHNSIIGVALKRQVRIVLPHPPVERIMQKQIGQQWTDYTSLRRALFTRNKPSLFILRRHFQPSFNVENYPLVLRVLPDRPHHQLMVDVIEGNHHTLPTSGTFPHR